MKKRVRSVAAVWTRGVVLAAGLAGASGAATLAWGESQQNAAPATRPAAGAGTTRPATDGGANRMARLGMAMVQQIRQVEGCLGAEAGQFSGNRFVVIAWFKDKASASKWVAHPMHVGMRRAAGMPAEPGEAVLEGVPDGVPIMTLASIAFDGPPAKPGSQIPFSAISIEVYAGMKGSLRVGNGFAPEGFFPGEKEGATTRPAAP